MEADAATHGLTLDRTGLELMEQDPEADSETIFRFLDADGVRARISDFKLQIATYKNLKTGRTTSMELTSLFDLSNALTSVRIAAGLTQDQLAKRLGLEAQEIERYERFGYESATLTRLNDIAKVLGMTFEGTARLPRPNAKRAAVSADAAK